jgi:hypothetical protein
LSPNKKTKKTRKNRPYSVGEVNKIIDALIHPHYKRNQWYRVLDGVVHGVVEGNVRVSTKKFVRYNLAEIAKKILEKVN